MVLWLIVGIEKDTDHNCKEGENMKKVRTPPKFKVVEMKDKQLMFEFSGTEVKPREEFTCTLRFDTNKPYKGTQLKFI